MEELQNLQYDAVQWMQKREAQDTFPDAQGGILADWCGMGKTHTVAKLLEAKDSEKIATIIISPKSTLSHWCKVLSEYKIQKPVHIAFDKQSLQTLSNINNPMIVISTHQTCMKAAEYAKVTNTTFGNFGRIIVDEAHALKNTKSKLHTMITSIRSQFRWALTATPIQNNVKDIFAIASFIHIDTTDVDVIKNKYMFRRTKQSDNPYQYRTININHTNPIILDLENKRINVKKEDEKYMQYQVACRQALVHPAIYLRSQGEKCINTQDALQFLMQADKYEKFYKSPKIEWLVNDIKQSNDKCIIFYDWHNEANLIRKVLAEHSIMSMTIDGRSNRYERDAILQSFEYTNTQVLFAQIKCMGCGVNIQMASKAYFTKPAWNPAMEAQAICRVHRTGQTKQVTITKLITPNSIDSECNTLQQSKIKMADQVLGDTIMTKLLCE